ncbi:alpha/beta-hydrolase [Sistotremastrum niveocremeum HHB9708]|uniref:Alpha/beta-hydrolase n=2 Tax=Sistotremastraceae TaxID=3402574 RepID=A0A164UDL8_9AGAM|nr:alpha/beta-hydrolase [Sistotremastrum niveocremeum HHB9708]KZT42561.1 alpha/beta-hydrolase [Sistotremastrum suecicum HHB10207 ss-3]
MDGIQYKDLKTPSGYTYHYAVAPGSPVTLLFLHGFPSSSYDWRHQVKYFTAKGYGVIVPDLLGYGGTDKPTEVEAYGKTQMAHDLVAILDAENVVNAIAIGHDWGSAPTARLANLYPDRFLAFAFLSVGYYPPRPDFEIESFLAVSKQHFGYETFGYWKWFNDDSSPALIEKNIDSFYDLVYPPDPQLWRNEMAEVGKAQAWVAANKRAAPPSWVTPEERKKHISILLSGGFRGPTNWYRHRVRPFGNEEDKLIPESKYDIEKPVFLAATVNDPICRPEVAKLFTSQHAKNLTIVDFQTGHWVQLEDPDGLNKALEEFFVKVVGQSPKL